MNVIARKVKKVMKVNIIDTLKDVVIAEDMVNHIVIQDGDGKPLFYLYEYMNTLCVLISK